jgi:hypothetical protein
MTQLAVLSPEGLDTRAGFFADPRPRTHLEDWLRSRIPVVDAIPFSRPKTHLSLDLRKTVQNMQIRTAVNGQSALVVGARMQAGIVDLGAVKGR